MWRGGGPTAKTLEWLGRHAHQHDQVLTLIDLRHPASSDDLSGKGGRLSPAAEKAWAVREHHRYHCLSALDPQLVPTIEQALRQGDVYIHCMYGVNRTGFAMGRYAVATSATLDRSGMGTRDVKQGEDFERAKAKR
jgi:hypothetical protein